MKAVRQEAIDKVMRHLREKKQAQLDYDIKKADEKFEAISAYDGLKKKRELKEAALRYMDANEETMKKVQEDLINYKYPQIIPKSLPAKEETVKDYIDASAARENNRIDFGQKIKSDALTKYLDTRGKGRYTDPDMEGEGRRKIRISAAERKRRSDRMKEMWRQKRL